jgi:hypothetical protein
MNVGWNVYTSHLGHRQDTGCFRCHNESRWILQKRRYFITLFFLPVVPVKTEYSYYCPICLNSETITGEKFEELLQSGAEAI